MRLWIFEKNQETKEVCDIDIIADSRENNMILDSIKLVIWDLDETFWQGTISEGPISFIRANIEALKKLTDRGIVNAICSKNDFEPVERALTDEQNIWQYFVFPSIDWTAKGARIKQLIEDMNLRPANVLFIDDNDSNLNEARFFCPDIQLLRADKLAELYAAIDVYEGKMDLDHSRLARYRVLEKKRVELSKADSNDAFLRDSNICIYVDHDCTDIDRIEELVGRTNQLNYTKLRDKKESLQVYIDQAQYETASIYARDKYGDYGCVGFYCLDKAQNRLIHFLFSCRTMGMGIEQWVYDQLEQPELEIVGAVAGSLNHEAGVDYIHEVSREVYLGKEKSKSNKQPKTDCSILFKGPCDLEAVVPLLENTGEVVTEFNYIGPKDTTIAGFNHSAHIVESLTLSTEEIQQILIDAPFMDEGDFKTRLFDKTYDVVFYSLLPDEHQGVYENKRTGWKISYNSRNYSLTDERMWSKYINGDYENSFPFTREILQKFSQSYRFIHDLSVADILHNLQVIREKLPSETLLVLMLGSEVESERNNAEFENSAPRHIEVNHAVEKQFGGMSNVKIINMTEFITSQDSFSGCTNHFSKKVYFDIANKVAEIINENTNSASKAYAPDSFHVKLKRRLMKFKHSFDKRVNKLRWRLKR